MADTAEHLDIGRVLNNTFGVIMRHPVIFIGLSFLIVALPQAVVQLATGASTASSDPDAMMAMFSSPSMVAAAAGGWLLVMILSVLLQATFIIGTVKDLNGQPGLILALMWIVASPVMMAEDKGIIDSLKRSAELTKGSKRWIVLLFVVYIILSSILGMLMIPFVFAGPVAIMLVGLVVNTLTGAIQGTGIAAVYVDLRIVKEGGNTDALADVFA